MDKADHDRIEIFLEKWLDSQGNERANCQPFFSDLCTALGVGLPFPKGSVKGDPYCFEKDVQIFHPSGKMTSGFIDFYKENYFLIEAKQGGTKSGKGTAKRGTESYRKAMERGFVQAISYTRHLPSKPPFLLTCDIGDHFELWLGFSGDYGGYGSRRDIPVADLRKPEVFALFVDMFTDPQRRNPEKIAAQVTREVAADLALLTKSLEGQYEAQAVALFLMRCIFTMFAEDVGLLKEHLFTEALEERWLKEPKRFKPELEALWQAMNEGTSFGFSGKLLRFNGGLFTDPGAFALTSAQIEQLLLAAKRDWQNVEPAIFGTLLERALDKRDRKKLGAHYTPRSYVERLVRPVVLEPLRSQWDLVQTEVDLLLKKKSAAKQKAAIALLEEFLQELQQVKVLDPACGTGNFLYVTMDLLKQLESEVLKRIGDITGSDQYRLDINQVNPSQFLGIEINPRAAAIADLVIWIGYLQWHFRRFGDIPPVEPVLREYKNIECRDAVLAYDGTEPDLDPKTGQVRTRWGGRKMRHSVTGEEVPDPSDQVPILRYLNPRPAVWPEADYIVSNPPFIGNARMREVFGDGYTEALRKSYESIPNTLDFVMYWWHKSAILLRIQKLKCFGLITTNTIRQVRQRQIIEFHQHQKEPIKLFFAISDHPWFDGDAAVTISMTAATIENTKNQKPLLGQVINSDSDNKWDIEYFKVNFINSSLQYLFSANDSTQLKANSALCAKGFEPGCLGFVVRPEEFNEKDRMFIRPFKKLSHLVKGKNLEFVIDVNNIKSEIELRSISSDIYQYLLNNVKSVRAVNNDKRLREEWWKYRRSNETLKNSLIGLSRYIVTGRTSKHRCFMFCEREAHCETEVICIGVDDAFYLGVLSSKLHSIWALSTRSDLGGNTPRYFHDICFNTFPFPTSTSNQKQTIRELGERLDAHRKQVQKQHPDITITGMYNLLEKMRSGEPFTDKDRDYNNRALISILKQIHDDLDRAVFAAYGWEPTLTDEEILANLVALNAQRAEEEKNGIVRWLRPEYQAPEQIQVQTVLDGVMDSEPEAIAPVEQQKFPSKLKDQLAAIRDLLRTRGGEWTLKQIIAQFKNASRKKKAIQECLESLTELGFINVHTETEQPRWYCEQ